MDGAQGLLGQGAVPAEASQAMPKSATLTLPSRRTMMFWGLMSRWMMPRLWAWPRARTIWVMKCSASRQFSWPLLLHILLQGDAVDQLHDDIFQVSRAADTSYTDTMLGWDSMATAWDSSWKRRRNSASWARSFFRIFTATNRFSRWHWAL